MSLELVQTLSSIIGTVAVSLTVVYLAIQIRSSTKAAVLHQSPDKRGVPLPVKMVSQLTQTWHSQVRSFC